MEALAFLFAIATFPLAIGAWITDGMGGAVFIGTACLSGILSRICQATHNAEVEHTKTDAILKALADLRQPTPQGGPSSDD